MDWPEIKRLVTGKFGSAKSITLLDGLDRLKFSYFGYDYRLRSYLWTVTFHGRLILSLPSTIRVEYTKDKTDEVLILPVKTESDWKDIYNDLFRTF